MTRVVASRYAVVIHAMCETPPRSPTMVGIAVETMVWSRAAISMPASSAAKIVLIRRRVSTIGGAAASVIGACTEVSSGSACGWPRPRARRERARGGGGRGPFSVRWRGGPGGEAVPGLGDEGGQGRGEVAGQPAVQRGAHRRGGAAGQQGGQDVDVRP